MKKLELALTRAWQEQSRWLGLLAPLSYLYGLVGRLRRKLYQKGIFSSYQPTVPVLVIGNITVGGSGKTPLIIALVKHLQDKNIQVGVISRGYGGDGQVQLVTRDSQPNQVGDEPCLIVQSAKPGRQIPMTVGANRQAAIELLLANYPDIELILSDDGLQHYALQRSAEWIVVDAKRGFGNQKLLPQGFLREPIERLKGATIIYHDTDIDQYPDHALTMHLICGDLVPLMDLKQPIPKAQTVHAISGIGYPKRFFDSLSDLGFSPICHPLDDHHDFGLSDLLPLQDYPIITTEKDAVKLRQLAKQDPHPIFERIWILPVTAKLSDSVYSALDVHLEHLHIGQVAQEV